MAHDGRWPQPIWDIAAYESWIYVGFHMSNALGILPFAWLILASLVIFTKRLQQLDGQGAWLRQFILEGAVLWGGWVVLGAEFLGMLNCLNFVGILLWWLVPVAGMIVWLVAHRGWLGGLRRTWVPLDAGAWGLVGVLVVLLGCVFLAAAGAPPNNHDSLSYHLPRQVMWIQQGNLAHFSTPNLRQIMDPPLAEYVGTSLMILTGGDRWSNFVQFGALILTMVAASALARQLGAGKKGQLLAALLVLAIPTAFMQGSNTKNDIVAALWVCIATSWVMQIQIDRTLSWWRAALLGLAFGEAMLTKGTGVIFLLPVAVCATYLVWRCLKISGTGRLVVIACVAIVLNAGHWSRNVRQFGDPVGPDAESKGGNFVLNSSWTPKVVLSNLTRSLALHALTPPLENQNLLNKWVVQSVQWFHKWIGIDLNDPRSTRGHGPTFDTVTFMGMHEDYAGAPIHLLLLALFPLTLWLVRKQVPMGRVLLLFGLAVAGFFIFTVLLSWQVWLTRLQIPAVCLLAPALAVVWSTPRSVALVPAVVCLLFLPLPTILTESERPIVGPRSVLVTDPVTVRCYAAPSSVQTSITIAQEVAASGAKLVGLFSGGDDLDYILERPILDRKPVKFTYFNATHPAKGATEPDPDVVLSINDAVSLVHESSGARYVATEFHPPYTLFRKTTDVGASLPVFYGWDKVDGLSPIQGPLPQYGLPVIRIAPSTGSTLTVQGDGQTRHLSMEFRPTDRPFCALRVVFNGQVVGDYAFQGNPNLRTADVDLATKPGENQLQFAYGVTQGPLPEGATMLFTRLQISQPAPKP
jgi:hypothetical protein